MSSLLLLTLSFATANPAAAQSLELLRNGERLIQSPRPADQLRGARLNARAYRAAPDLLETTAGMSHAFFVRARLARDKAKGIQLARRGAKVAQRLVKRWPGRAEGYYWAAVNTALIAERAGAAEAISQGLIRRIERLAQAAMDRDRTLYRGAVPRMLGRLYYLLPWPLRDNEQALSLLREAHGMDPDHAKGLHYLGDILHRGGKETEARDAYARCVRATSPDPETTRRCREALSSL